MAQEKAFFVLKIFLHVTVSQQNESPQDTPSHLLEWLKEQWQALGAGGRAAAGASPRARGRIRELSTKVAEQLCRVTAL